MCVWRLRATTNARRIRRAASPLETVRRRRGLKVAIPVRFIFSFTVHRCATFARRRRTVSTFGLRQMPATRKPPTRYTKAHKISRINELPPQKGIFHFVSGFRPVFVSCGRRAPQGAAVVARLARHRLKPCRGDMAACCRKATRRLQGSWSRVALSQIRKSV